MSEPSREEKIAAARILSGRWQRSDWLAVPILVLAAALLRLWNLDYMEFKGDEANNLYVASYITLGEGFPLAGMRSSIGTFNPPLFTYLMALPLSFSRNPVAAAAFVALVNCAAVGLLYAFCRRYFNRIVAVVAAVFFAVNPWAVIYSRKIWQQDMLPLFVVGFFYCLFAVVCEGRRKLFLGCCACFAAMTQFHLSSIYYLAVFALTVLWFRPKVGWGYYAGGIGLVLLIYSPYIAFDILHHGYNWEIYLRHGNLPPRLHPEALTVPFVLGSTLGFMHFVDWPWLDVVQGLLIAAGAVYVMFHLREPNYFITLLWLCVPALFLLISKLDMPPHYFLFLYPVQFVLLGILGHALVRRLEANRVLRSGVAALLVALAGYQLQSSVKLVTSIDDQPNVAWEEYGAEYGPPFRYRVEEIRRWVGQGVIEPEQVQKKLLEGKPPNLTRKYDFPATAYIVENLDAL
jgi:4-amino-4-deoxy-L-arabinose transferase-like glycosyltransferase